MAIQPNGKELMDEIVSKIVELSLESTQKDEVGSIYAVYIAVGLQLQNVFKEIRGNKG